jgi:hypothetical protein
MTSAALAAGLQLTTFTSDFPQRSDGLGPFGLGLPASGGVPVTDGAGNVRLFPSDTDGQDAVSVPPTPGAADFAAGIASLSNQLYITLHYAN